MSIHSDRVAQLAMHLREMADNIQDVYVPFTYTNGQTDAELLYLAAAYIDHLEATLAKLRRAIGNCA